MAVNAGDTITAAQYNGLQSRIEQVLGNGSADFGYGQAVSSAQVTAVTDSITAAQLDNIRSDMGKAFTHQSGEAIPLKDIAVGDIIGADQTGTDLTFAEDGSYTFVGPDNTGGFNDFLNVMTTIETNRFNIAAGQSTASDIATDSRTSTWNGTINMEFTVTFTDADARRHFFNSGGQIRVQSTLTSGSGSKDADWAAMLSNPGQIQFGYNSTTVTGSTTGVTLAAFGNNSLTGTYQTVFEKGGNASVYAENRYRLEARTDSTSILRFRVTFEDNDVGDRPVDPPPPPFGALEDESITGDITVTLGARRASGTNVSVNFPSYSIVNTLE
jgi:hypothetical protein